VHRFVPRRVWLSFENAIARCEHAVTIARKRIGWQAQVLLSTDSIDVQNAILKRVEGVISRPKQFCGSGSGELHHSDRAWMGRNDALVEMLLLAKCKVLIRYAPVSFFFFLRGCYEALLRAAT
jgi:nodulation protein Z